MDPPLLKTIYKKERIPMKKRFAVLTAAFTAVLLWGCAPQEEPPIAQTRVTIPPAETTVSAAQPEVDSPADAAFQRALKTIHEELRWPDMPNGEAIALWEPGTIEDEQFAILDVDGDGEQELLVCVANTYMAGMREVVYGYDAASDGLRVEAEAFPGAIYYPGMMKVLSSHNQGHAGDVLWPYTIAIYHELEDAYRYAYYVDAWSREISETDFEGNPYPEDVDVDGDGYVYLITEGDETRVLNRADYERWETGLLADREAISIPWQKLTMENIG